MIRLALPLAIASVSFGTYAAASSNHPGWCIGVGN